MRDSRGREELDLFGELCDSTIVITLSLRYVTFV
jgi:hypothetical protein